MYEGGRRGTKRTFEEYDDGKCPQCFKMTCRSVAKLNKIVPFHLQPCYIIPLDGEGEDPDASANREKKAREKLIKDEFEKRKGPKLNKKEEIKKEKERVKDEQDMIRTAKVYTF